jgi:hypothetical protein
VFGEQDVKRRLNVIAELYSADAIFYEPDRSVTGHAAISQAVTTLLSGFPSDFVFTAVGPAVGHHGAARLRWRCGPPNGPVAVSGTDVAWFRGAHIQTLHVFIDPVVT